MKHCNEKPENHLFPGLLLAVVAFFICLNVQAGIIRVSQETAAGAGDFDANVLGTIDPFVTALSTSQFYQYNVPNGSSYNGELNGGPIPISSTSQVFFVNASDGLSLVVVHDNPSDGSGGSTQTRWNLTGDTAAQVLADDAGEPITVSMGGTQFDSTKNWIGCCTDGYAIGAISGTWALFGQFLTTPSGISNWTVVNDDFSSTNLVLTPGRRVRLDLAGGGPQQMPSPGVLALLGLGLFGMGYQRRQKAKAA